MKATGNSIVLRNVFVGISFEMQPVMRNGKPTKRMKRVCVDKVADCTATGYEIDGHEVFLLDRDMEKENDYFVRVYKADGERLTCMCKYGRYGEADHEQTYNYDKRNGRLFTDGHGYCGATFRGAGARITRVNW